MNTFTVMRRFGIILVGMMFVGNIAIGQQEKSLMINGDFEGAVAGQIPGWSRSFYPQHEGDINRCIRPSDTRARSGLWSLEIDTEPVLGEEVTLVFNGAVSDEATRMRGKRLVLSGWVYVEPDAALRPIGVRLRTFGKDETGAGVFLGDVLSLSILGKPGEWVPFRASGKLPDAEVTNMDLHCAIRPDMVRTNQFLDDLSVEIHPAAPLEMQLLRDALWSDEKVLPVEVSLSNEAAEAKSLTFRLIDAGRNAVAEWSRQPQTAILGLPLTETSLPEGRYLLQSQLRNGKGNALASAEASLEVATSPWADAPKIHSGPTESQRAGEVPEGFRVMGTVAPTDAPDALPEQQETLSPDMEMSRWRERGYAVFSRHYLDLVSRLGRPRPGEFGPVRLFACPGEYEPASISIWAMRDQRDVRMTATDLVGEDGTISRDNVDIRVVRTVQGLPSFLEKRREIDIPADQTQTFWLTVYVPPDTGPGFYSGSIEVSPENSDSARVETRHVVSLHRHHSDSSRVELLLRVLPLELPPPPKGYGFWWKMDARWNGYYSKERETALEQIRRQFVLLREHGCNMVACYGMPKMAKEEDGTMAFDFEKDHWGHDAYSLADFFRLGQETGFLSPEVPIQYTGADSLHSSWIARFAELDAESGAFDDFYRDACRRVDEWAKDLGFRLGFACIDEIGNSAERRQNALRFYRVAKEAGTLTSVTDNSMHGGMHLMGQPRFNDIIDMRLYNFITPEMTEHAHQSGDNLWLYNLGSGGWDGKRDRFVFGLFTERCGAEGHSQWAFQWPSENIDPYEAVAIGKRSGYHYALPSPDGPLPTLALEGVREGIDDARYLVLLHQELPGSEAALLDDIEPFSTRIGDYISNHSGSFFDIRRWRMARAAIK